MNRNGKSFELFPININNPSIPSDTVVWNYSTKFKGCTTAAFGKYLFSIFIKQGKQLVETTKENIKTFYRPAAALNDIIIFTSLAVCVKPKVFESYKIEDPVGMVKELIKLIDYYMIIRDVITSVQMPTKEYIKAAVKELTDKYYDYINEIVDREFKK